MKAPKVVCDVTVFLQAALLPESDAGQLLRRFIEQRDFEIVLSQALLERIECAFRDPEIRELMPSPRESERWMAALGVLTTTVEVLDQPPAAGQDSRDDPCLAAILAIGGGLVLTTDPRLLAVSGVPGVEVVAPAALIELLEANQRVSR